MGRLVALAAGAGPDAPPDPSGRLMWPPHDRLTRTVRLLGWPVPVMGVAAADGGFRAHVDILPPGLAPLSFEGSGKTRALEEACELACGSLPAAAAAPVREAELTAELIVEASEAHAGYPERILSVLCNMASRDAPEVDVLRSADGTVRVRVAAAGFVAVRTGETVREARGRATADVLGSIAETVPGAGPPGRN